MTKILAVRVEDNSVYISSLQRCRMEAEKNIEAITSGVEELQQENLIKILTYVKCMYEDFVQILGGSNKASNKVFLAQKSSVAIRVINNKCYVIFDYSGTIEASFENNGIQILQSSPRCITDLCLRWKALKPELQTRIKEVVKSVTTTINNDINVAIRNKQIAEGFEV